VRQGKECKQKELASVVFMQCCSTAGHIRILDMMQAPEKRKLSPGSDKDVLLFITIHHLSISRPTESLKK
jgi:hypothetical protein